MAITQRRLVLEYDQGSAAFRNISPSASLENIFMLAKQINSLQTDTARRVLLVTVNTF